MFHRMQVWWEMWLEVRFKVYWVTLATTVPLAFYLWAPILMPELLTEQMGFEDTMFTFTFFWCCFCAFATPVLEGLYKFELRMEDRVIRRRNHKKAQGGELSVLEGE